MFKIHSIVDFLNSKYKEKHAEEWDKVGLIYGSSEKRITNITVGLDLTTELFDVATKNKSELIVVHHPFIFEDTEEEEIEKRPYKGRLIRRINGVDMGVIVVHTNFDTAPRGMTKLTFEKLNIVNYFEIPDTHYGGSFFWDKPFSELITLLRTQLAVNWHLTSFEDASKVKIEKIAIYPGSCGSEEVVAAKKNGCDLVISSDFKWSTYILAKELDIHLLQVSHHIENIFTTEVASQLHEKFGKNGKLFVHKYDQADLIFGAKNGK